MARKRGSSGNGAGLGCLSTILILGFVFWAIKSLWKWFLLAVLIFLGCFLVYKLVRQIIERKHSSEIDLDLTPIKDEPVVNLSSANSLDELRWNPDFVERSLERGPSRIERIEDELGAVSSELEYEREYRRTVEEKLAAEQQRLHKMNLRVQIAERKQHDAETALFDERGFCYSLRQQLECVESEKLKIEEKLFELDQKAIYGEPLTRCSDVENHSEFESFWDDDLELDLPSTSDSWCDFVNDMTGEEFEAYCMFLLDSHRFENVRGTKLSGDHGIDIMASKDAIDYVIQCKRFQNNNVGSDAISEVHKGRSLVLNRIGKDDLMVRAVIMTNSDFTKQAKEEAVDLNIWLVNGDCLWRMESARQEHILLNNIPHISLHKY